MKKKTWERRLDDAKKRHRPKLMNWSRDGFASQRLEDFLVFCSHVPRINELTKKDIKYLNNDSLALKALDERTYAVARVSCQDLTTKQFVDLFERRSIPCVISGIPEDEHWPAMENWTFKKLVSRFGPSLFKIGEDDDGYKIKVRMKYFLKYLKSNVDDSPLYCFDSTYDVNSSTKPLLTDYKVPSYFPHDLFSLVGEKRRPPYRWFLVGPSRSGTTLHVDPLGTSAWNTSIVGRKRWILFPPGTPKSVAKGLDVIKKGEDDEAVNYFIDLVPRIKAKHPEVKIMEFIQQSGDTVYVPGGWWHAVINLDDTIAITQNYCSPANFDAVWKKTRGGRKKMSVKWLRLLHEQYPELAARAEQLNTDDGFEMYKSTRTQVAEDVPATESKSEKNSKKRKRDESDKLVETKPDHGESAIICECTSNGQTNEKSAVMKSKKSKKHS